VIEHNAAKAEFRKAIEAVRAHLTPPGPRNKRQVPPAVAAIAYRLLRALEAPVAVVTPPVEPKDDPKPKAKPKAK